MRKMGYSQTGRVELGSLKLRVLRGRHATPLPTPLCPRSSQSLSLDSFMNKQITPKQGASVCFLPCAASALCLPNIPLGFVAFPSALLTSRWGCFMTQRQGEAWWAEAAEHG